MVSRNRPRQNRAVPWRRTTAERLFGMGVCSTFGMKIAEVGEVLDYCSLLVAGDAVLIAPVSTRIPCYFTGNTGILGL
jgi:hypothetical protein